MKFNGSKQKFDTIYYYYIQISQTIQIFFVILYCQYPLTNPFLAEIGFVPVIPPILITKFLKKLLIQTNPKPLTVLQEGPSLSESEESEDEDEEDVLDPDDEDEDEAELEDGDLCFLFLFSFLSLFDFSDSDSSLKTQNVLMDENKKCK